MVPGKVELREDVIPLLGYTLGVSCNLCGKDHTGTGKFLESHYGGNFLAFSPPNRQFLEGRDWD